MSLPHSGDQRKTNLDRDRRADHTNDRCAVLTGTGRSAIAVIGLWGSNAATILGRCFDPATKAKLTAGQIRYGNWTGLQQQESPAESVVVTPIHTAATDAESFEIHCHGGAAAIERIVSDLQACGAKRTAAWDSFPVENLLIREAKSTLSNCLTARIAAIAMDQVRGLLADWATRWINTIDSISTVGDSNALSGLRQEAESILDRAPIGVRLAEPFRVVLVGSPNVGKSSLVNAIVGYDRSITFDQAGTTRDVLHADTVIDGIPIRLSDTAGIRASEQAIEREGVARALAAAESADLVLIVTSAEALAAGQTDGPGMPAAMTVQSASKLPVLNKRDLIPADEFPPQIAIATNALTGEGIPELLQAIADRLGRILPSPGQPVPLNERQADRLGELTRVADPTQIKSILQRLIGVPK